MTLTPLPAGRLARFAYGLRSPFRGARWLLAHSPLWPWAALPMLMTVWSILGAGAIAWYGADDLLGMWWPKPRGTARIAWDLVLAMIMLTSFMVSALGLWILGHLVAGPFYDRLAELVEGQVLGREEQPFDWRVAVGDALQSFAHSLLGLALYLGLLLPLLALHLVPGIGSVAYSVIGAALTAAFLAREMFDVPLSRRRTPFLAKVAYLVEHRWAVFGLGTATALLLAVPLVDLIILPCAVLGATLLFIAIEIDAARLVPRPSAEADASPTTDGGVGEAPPLR